MTRNRIMMLGAVVVLIIGGWMAQRHFVAGSGGAGGDAMVEVKVPSLSGDAAEGEVAFNKNCAACHGKNAAGQNGVAPPLVHIVYEPNHHGDMSFRLAVKNGVRQHHWRFGNMPPLQGVSNREVETIISYVRSLQRENGIR